MRYNWRCGLIGVVGPQSLVGVGQAREMNHLVVAGFGRVRALSLLSLAVVAGSVGCSDESGESEESAAAGAPGTGGLAAVGGQGFGGAPGTGGALNPGAGGGPAAAGGTPAAGGAPAGVGGALGSGGAGVGGTLGDGGDVAGVGGNPAGGAPGAGGAAPGAGGAPASGGAPAAGGSPAEGGSPGVGGTPESGGSAGASVGGSGTGGAAPGGAGGDVGIGGAIVATGGVGGGTTTSYYLSDLCEMADPVNAWGPIEKNLSNGEEAAQDGGPITIGDTVYSHGLGVHAPADIGYALGGNCTMFSATVGVDDEMRDGGSVVFEVWGDGTQLQQTATITGAAAGTTIDVDITGVQELHLVVSDDGGNGSDHADWAEARVECYGAPISTCTPTPPPVDAPSGYQLVWSDEFDVEGAPNPANWTYEHGFARNEELQWYQEDNAWVQAGFLIIEGRREQVANPNYQAGSGDWKTNREYAEYTSTSLAGWGLQSWQYGIFELRGRIVAEAGLWPAWWTLGVSQPWPEQGEIDIMEYYNGGLHANFAVGSGEQWVARWDSQTHAISSFGDDDWDSKFHIWRMEWNDQTITLLVDGQVLNDTVIDDMLNPDGFAPFRQAHHMLINLAIGGSAGGDPSGTHFPTRYEVDYVRVFQQ